jgi:hypothetical protein
VEEWRSVEGYEDRYAVSNLGRIKNVRHGNILSPGKNEKGYLYIVLYKDGKSSPKRVHRIVASAFLGKSSLEINHKDGDKTNNRVDNLEYCTHSQNIRHAMDCGLLQNKKPVAMIDNDGNVIKIFESISKAEAETGAFAVGRACKRHIRAKGYYWSLVEA